jgi:hypothetical protein
MVQATSDTDNTKENTGSVAQESKDMNKDDEKEGTYSKANKKDVQKEAATSSEDKNKDVEKAAVTSSKVTTRARQRRGGSSSKGATKD